MIKKDISPAKKGMNRDSHPSELQKEEYSFALNTNFHDEHGSGPIVLQNEPSNIKCSGFLPGYKVVGHKFDINADRTYFFLTNPITGCSEIGYINSLSSINGLEQVEAECGCNIQVIIENPLENTVQQSVCTYYTLLSDCCPGLVEGNGCLNFDVNRPIKQGNIEIKDEKIGKVLYWTDGHNPPRYLKVDHIDSYYVDEDLCEGEVVETCLQCDKLRIFPLFDKPCLEPVVIQIGGALKAGAYEAFIAYSDEFGSIASSFYSFTNLVSIFDRNNTILDQTVLDYQTTQAIELSVTDLDNSFDFFTIVVGYRSGLDTASVYKIYGTYPTSTTKVVIDSIEDKDRIEFREIVNRKPSYQTSEGLTNVNGYLFQYNLTSQREINLQPVVNLMGAFVKWQTVIADEDLYQDGVAVAKYKGYMRDEVYPLSIKFFMEGGYESPNFVFIPRPPKASEIQLMDTGDLNYQSVVAAAPDCAEIGRDKVWQFENTADPDSISLCLMPSSPGVEEGEPIIEQVEFICTVSDELGNELAVDEVASGEVEVITSLNLIDLINNNIDDIIASTSPFDGAQWDDIRNILSAEYTELECDPSFGDHCNQDGITLLSYLIYAISVGEVEELSELIDPTVTPASYTPVADPPPSCVSRMFIVDPLAEDPETYLEDSNYSCVGSPVYRRISGMPNTTPAAAQIIPPLTSPQISNSNSLVNSIGTTAASLQTTFDATPFGPGTAWTNKVHINALWYKTNTSSTGYTVVEITPQTCSLTDANNGTAVRITVFDGDTSTPVSSYDVVLTDLSQRNLSLFDNTDFPSNNILIAIDSPIKEWGAECFTLTPPCGCFSIYTREALFIKSISFKNLAFGKRMTWATDCTFTTPIIKGCDPLPYNNGEFAYWESSLKYPCNPELYDSSGLEIKTTDLEELSFEDKIKFEQYYTSGTTFGVYNLTAEANFMDKPIRHYKFPDNRVSPFMSLVQNKPKDFNNSAIFPIGFHIDNKVINAFLDVAVNNGLISLEERSKVKSYEVFRGDRRTDKAIIAKGLLFDTYRYNEGAQEIFYPNYPLNTLGADFFNGTTANHKYNSLRNNMFTFHSPEIHYYKPTIPNELNLEAYMFGKSSTIFDEVKDYPKYVILGSVLTDLATTLAVAEVVLDITSQVFNWIIDATAAGTYPGVVLSLVSAVLAGVSLTIQGIMKAGELRQKWIDIFTNLGYPYNFAYYMSTVGHYGWIEPNDKLPSHKYRGIQVRGYLKDGNWDFPNEFNGTSIRVNNLLREDSVLVSFGPSSFAINYPPNYVNYDNYTSSPGNSSRKPYTGVGRSAKSIGNAASPYASLKQYLPSQYGTVNSIEWVNTGYCGRLDEDNYCEPIFGGDIFISRFALKRKLSFFIANAFGQASFTPYEHSFYFNIAPVDSSGVATSNNRWFINYLINDESLYYTSLFTFPTNDSIYNLWPTPPDNDTYIKPPSKFYVFAYGFPYFLAESQYNSNYRYGKPGMDKNFYPNFKDVIEYTQERNVSIRELNTYYYNDVYSITPSRNPWRMLPQTYKRVLQDRVNDGTNRVIYSRRDVSETSLVDPWLIYRGLDYYDFPNSYGKLVSIDDMGSEQAIGRFTNGYTIYGAIDVLADRLQPENRLTGAGGIFSGRNINFNKTELGYAGTQHTQIVSCDFGHFWADAKRGKVFQLATGGKGLQEITGGLEKWFKENLPFKILNFFPNLDIDNNYAGVGLAMGWDDRLRRLFLTKLDYTPNCGCLEYTEGEGFYQNLTECEGAEQVPVCPPGFIFNEERGNCQRQFITSACPDGYIWDDDKKSCIRVTLECPEGFTEDESGNCQQFVSVGKIIEGETVFVEQAGTGSHGFSTPALYSTYNPDGTANVDGSSPTGFTYTDLTHPFWTGFGVVGDRVVVRLAKWGPIPLGQWFGGGIYVNVPSTKTYYVAIAADDLFRFSVDGTTLLTSVVANMGVQHTIGTPSQICFAKLHIYPIVLEEGCRYIQVEGLNNFGPGLFAAMILDNTSAEITSATSLDDLSVIYSTENIFEFLSDPSPTNACPDGLTATGDSLCDMCEGFIESDKVEVIDSVEPSCESSCILDEGTCVCTVVQSPTYIDNKIPVSLDSDCFTPCHWTVAYSPVTQTWISYYSFTPNYYVGYHNYFQTGMNTDDDRFGLWSHFPFLSSYQVFYGELFPFKIEYSTHTKYMNSVLHSIEYWMDVRKYYNKYDFADVYGFGFNKAIVYNMQNNSGLLNLIHQKENNINQLIQFPKFNTNSVDVLQTEQHGKWSFNGFNNLIKNERSGLPLWIYDCAQVDKSLDNRLLDFRNNFKDRLRGDYFLVRLIQDLESRYKFLFRFAADKRNYYE